MNDDQRLAALRGHDILDTPTDAQFDRIAELVRLTCDVPIALVSLVDEHRQWFKAAAGTTLSQTPIDTSICALAIRQAKLFQIEDLSADERTSAMSLVTAPGGIRFYAGVPLVDYAGAALGSLCAIDVAPRPGGLTERQKAALTLLAAEVVTAIEARSAAAAANPERSTEETRRRARNAEARMHAVTSAARLGTFDYEPQSGRLVWDDKCRELFGLPPGAPVSYEGTYLAGLHPDDRDAADAAVQAALDPAGSGAFEIEYRTVGIEDRRLRHVAARGQAYFEHGRPVYFIGTVQDITELKLANALQLETEERLQYASRATNDAIWDWDLVRDHVGWNEALETVYGHRLDEIAQDGAWWIAHIHPDDRARIDQSIHAAIDHGDTDWSESYRFRRADGSYADVRDRGFVIRDAGGTAIRMIGAMLDQTEQMELQRRLRHERDRVWETTSDLMGTAGFDGFMKSVNPAWARALGWTEQELLRTPFAEFVDPTDRDETATIVRRLATGEAVTGFVDRLICRDGGFRIVDWQAVPDLPAGLFHIVGRDITEQRSAEDALRQSQKMEAVGQLTGGLAHDFNNLLAAISGGLELVEMRLKQGRVSEVDKYMTAAQGAARRAAALTHRLLAFSRRQALDPKPTDVNKLIAGMHELIQRTVGPSLHVEVVGASGLWSVLVDPPQLENALLNLCINARDAMPDGGRITIETGNKWIDRTAAKRHDMPEGQYLSLCVTDTGAGMPPEVVAKAFDPFFTTKPIGQGTGLGLSMIYGFAKQSGGQVRIYSEVGEGTTVCIYLPRHADVQVRHDDPAPSTTIARAHQGETVLIVDDEPAIRMLVTDILQDIGYRAIEAADSSSGLRILQSDARIDLLVTDVGLPGGMNGRQMAEAGRSTRPDLKVLFITGYAENALLGNGQLERGMAVLTKPFAIEALAARIREMIE